MLVLVIVLILRVAELMKVAFISDRDFAPSINSGNLFTPSSTKTTGSRSKKSELHHNVYIFECPSIDDPLGWHIFLHVFYMLPLPSACSSF
jgi:hypothetical protein